MRARVRGEGGFALIEMLIAIVVINIGLLAILLALTSGVTTLRRSAETSTASAVADRQLEKYRAVAFTSIYLDTAALAVAATDATYNQDAAYSASQVNQTCGTLTAVCTPTQTVTGPDGRSYRVDTYIVWTTPSGGTAVKQVTVVVRKSGSTATLARVVSTAGADF
jgi:type II secretory pathway pseudopilin PulG